MSRFGVRRPCCGIVVFSAATRKSCLERGLRPLTAVTPGPEPYDPLIFLRKQSERDRQRSDVAIESLRCSIRSFFRHSAIHCEEPSSRKDCGAGPAPLQYASVRYLIV